MSEPLKSALPDKDRRKKVWSSEDQILAAIDKKKELMEKKRSLAEEKNLEAKRLAIEAQEAEDEGRPQHAKGLRLSFQKRQSEAKQAERAYVRLQDKTIPRLGEALAAMRTQTMPELIGRYKGVVI